MLSGTIKIGDIELPWTAAEIAHERRVVAVSVPGVPGQIVEDLGRGGYTVSLAVTLCGQDWRDRLDSLLSVLDTSPAMDVRVADGRCWHAVLVRIRERWRLVDGVELLLDVVEDSQVDTIATATGTSVPSATLRPWPVASAAAAALEALQADVGPPTLGELVDAYGGLARALEAILAAQDAASAEGAETARVCVTAQAVALASLPLDARAAVAVASGRVVLS